MSSADYRELRIIELRISDSQLYCEMLLLYEQCNQNKREVARLYGIKFPNQKHQSYCIIACSVQPLYKTRSCDRRIPLSRAMPSSLQLLLRMF